MASHPNNGHHDGDYYLDVAKRNNLEVRNGHGSHAVVKAPPGTQPDPDTDFRPITVIPRGSLSPGVESSIRKWFLRIGILLALVIAAWVAL